MRPSGLNATPRTPAVCPMSDEKFSPRSAVPDPDGLVELAEARRRPSGLYAMQLTLRMTAQGQEVLASGDVQRITLCRRGPRRWCDRPG